MGFDSQFLNPKITEYPMTRLSTVDRAKRMCAKLAQFALPEKTKAKRFTVRLGHRQWIVSNFSELPLCVRAILNRDQRQQIVDRELQQQTTASVSWFGGMSH